MTAGDVLTLDELRDLRRTSTARGAWLVLHAWMTIAAAMAVYTIWPSPVTHVVGVVVIGARQLGLLILMHEAAHWLLVRRVPVNTWMGTWLCGAPVGRGDLPGYRRAHHLHHRHTLQPEDPEIDACAVVPRALWLGLAQDLVGWTALRSALRPRPWRQVWKPLAGNALLLGVLAAVGHWEVYVLLWLVPLATWVPVLERLRCLAEHAAVPHAEDPLRHARTTAAGWLARGMLAPYWVNYHLEHHLMVFVPCWKLARAHALLLGKGFGPRMEVAESYLDVVRRVTSA